MTISRRHLIASAIAMAAFSPALPALAAGGADDYVNQLGQDVLRLARGGHRGDKGLQRRFGALLNRYINLPGIANFALGPYRASLPAGDKGMFYDLVSNYAAALFVWYVSDFQGSDLTVTKSVPQGNFTLVETRIDGHGEPLNWRVSGSGGGYRVADVNIRGVWLTIAMQDMFQRTLSASHGDFKPLYQKLREADTW